MTWFLEDLPLQNASLLPWSPLLVKAQLATYGYVRAKRYGISSHLFYPKTLDCNCFVTVKYYLLQSCRIEMLSFSNFENILSFKELKAYADTCIQHF